MTGEVKACRVCGTTENLRVSGKYTENICQFHHQERVNANSKRRHQEMKEAEAYLTRLRPTLLKIISHFENMVAHGTTTERVYYGALLAELKSASFGGDK